MKIAGLFSGGKDSAFALYKALQEGHKPVCLITIKSKRADSYMFHIPNIDLTRVQAEALEIPIIYMNSSGVKEKELEDLKKAMAIAKKRYKIQGLVSGALASKYQSSRIKKLCDELDLISITPLWGMDEEQYLKDLIDAKFKIIITGIAADGLNKSWLGRKIDNNCITDLKKLHEKNKIHIAGEGGEYETFVLDCPLFKKKIEIKDFEIKMENECTGQYIIKATEFVKK
ncbi:diphthine--ammonia ligase [Candidatus Woesearchaeota archaeon]|nr:diphthine--ammonia ligase [Candidatus Woesearchaeota archaeon]MBU3942106.1 diphthine--ammonia ligase [Nanoarchaeota archaeon]